MTTPVRDEINRYLRRMPNAREAHLNDPQYQWQMQWVQRILELADLAMEDETIPEDARLRIIRTVLYGTADESEAMSRIDTAQKLARESAKGTVIPPEVLEMLRR